MPTHCDSVRCSLKGTPGATAKKRVSMPSTPAHGAIPRTHLALRATLGSGLRLGLGLRQVVPVVVVVVVVVVVNVVVDVADVVDVVDVVIVVDVVVVVDVVDATPPALFVLRTTVSKGAVLGLLAMLHLCTNLGSGLRLSLRLRQVVVVVVVVVDMAVMEPTLFAFR